MKNNASRNNSDKMGVNEDERQGFENKRIYDGRGLQQEVDPGRKREIETTNRAGQNGSGRIYEKALTISVHEK